jgi:hypothetical protein
MTKLLTTLTLAFFATVAFNAQAASHAGGAPMKADKPAAAASGAKADAAKPAAAKPAASAAKKEEAKK